MQACISLLFCLEHVVFVFVPFKLVPFLHRMGLNMSWRDWWTNYQSEGHFVSAYACHEHVGYNWKLSNCKNRSRRQLHIQGCISRIYIYMIYDIILTTYVTSRCKAAPDFGALFNSWRGLFTTRWARWWTYLWHLYGGSFFCLQSLCCVGYKIEPIIYIYNIYIFF